MKAQAHPKTEWSPRRAATGRPTLPPSERLTDWSAAYTVRTPHPSAGRRRAGEGDGVVHPSDFLCSSPLPEARERRGVQTSEQAGELSSRPLPELCERRGPLACGRTRPIGFRKSTGAFGGQSAVLVQTSEQAGVELFRGPCAIAGARWIGVGAGAWRSCWRWVRVVGTPSPIFDRRLAPQR